MSIFGKTPNFDFMGKRRLAEVLSAVMIIVSLGSIFVRGMNFGIDFTGGVLLEVDREQPGWGQHDGLAAGVERGRGGAVALEHDIDRDVAA